MEKSYKQTIRSLEETARRQEEMLKNMFKRLPQGHDGHEKVGKPKSFRWFFPIIIYLIASTFIFSGIKSIFISFYESYKQTV